jgi:hypothetical protein
MNPGPTPAAAARQVGLGARLLVGYAAAVAAVLAAVGASTSGIQVFSRAALGLVVAGCVLLGAVGAVHRRTRRALIRRQPGLEALLGRGPRPGGGWAVLAYLPLLLAAVSVGSVSLAVAHPPSGVLMQSVMVVVFLELAGAMGARYDRSIRAPYLAALRAAAGARPDQDGFTWDLGSGPNSGNFGGG